MGLVEWAQVNRGGELFFLAVVTSDPTPLRTAAAPGADVEVIVLGDRFLRERGLTAVTLHLNSIGDATCRPAYVADLTDYYRAHAAELPPLGSQAKAWAASFGHGAVATAEKRDGKWTFAMAGQPCSCNPGDGVTVCPSSKFGTSSARGIV